jgi:hypothetical protein
VGGNFFLHLLSLLYYQRPLFFPESESAGVHTWQYVGTFLIPASCLFFALFSKTCPPRTVESVVGVGCATMGMILGWMLSGS